MERDRQEEHAERGRDCVAGGLEQVQVSVLIPVLNASGVLPDQLEALTRQTFDGSWEVVIADNGSTDGLREVARAFESRLPALRVVRADGRPGPSHARNIAAREAAGELLLFCDADDVVSPGWIEAMRSASEGTFVLAGSGAHARDPHSLGPSDGCVPCPGNFRFLPWSGTGNLGVPHRIFRALDGFSEERIIGEDVDFCWRAQLAGYELRFVSDAFVAYRDRSNITNSMRRQYRWGKAATGLYLDFHFEGAPQPTIRWVLKSFVFAIRRLPAAIVERDMRGWLQTVCGRFGQLVGLLEFDHSR